MQVSAIEALGAVVTGHVVKVGGPVELYQVFELLKPLPLVQVKGAGRPTEIF